MVGCQDGEPPGGSIHDGSSDPTGLDAGAREVGADRPDVAVDGRSLTDANGDSPDVVDARRDGPRHLPDVVQEAQDAPLTTPTDADAASWPSDDSDTSDPRSQDASDEVVPTTGLEAGAVDGAAAPDGARFDASLVHDSRPDAADDAPETPDYIPSCNLLEVSTPAAGSLQAKQLSLGYNRTCAITADDSLWCWGIASGRVGGEPSLDQVVPAPVPGLGPVAEVAVAEGYTCARLKAGGVRCWGHPFGPLVDKEVETPKPYLEFTDIAGAEQAVQLTVYYNDACALLADGGVTCWTAGRATSTRVAGLAGVRAVRLGAGIRRCMVLADRTVACNDGNALVPVANVHDVDKLFGSDWGLCAIQTDGDTMCWGTTYNPDLGTEYVEWNVARKLVAFSGAQQIALGYNGACALRDSTVHCFTKVGSDALDGMTGVAEVQMGLSHTCVRTTTGRVRCGSLGTSYGETGDGTKDVYSSPAEAPLPAEAEEIEFGSESACGRWPDGSVRCWGGNSGGQLGNGTTTNSPVPVVVSDLRALPGLALGFLHACARTEAGGVRCWGDGGANGLGDGTTKISSTPVDVVGLTGNVQQVTSSNDLNCALIEDGSVMCWGDYDGEVRAVGYRGPATPAWSRPQRIPGLEAVKQIANGKNFACALQQDGKVLCWGRGYGAPLGTSTPDPAVVTTPVYVGVSGDIVQLKAAAWKACARFASGDLRCWDYRSTDPVLQHTLDVQPGADFACALLEDRTVACQGGGGALMGRGIRGARYFGPAPVRHLCDARALMGGYQVMCSRLGDGSYRCWGIIPNGVMGQATPRMFGASNWVIGF